VEDIAVKTSRRIDPANGKLAVLLPGLGAVATTTIAGVMLARRGLAQPIGSLTQMGTISVGARTNGNSPRIGEYAPLATLDQLEFGGWDIFPDDAYESAVHADVLESRHLTPIKDELAQVKPMRGVFYPEHVKRLNGTYVKTGRSKADMVEQLRADIRDFIKDRGCTRAVAVWCGSTEAFLETNGVHESVAAFERGLAESAPSITNSQMYAWAFMKEGVPFANGSPNRAVDFRAASDLAREHHVAVAGKDFKTGQTLIKTVIAPALKARALGLRGWYSTNILGNRDGEVLDDAGSCQTKEQSKLGVLDTLLDGASQKELYGSIVHKVRIEYYPPRGDAKESWDNIDLFGWLGYPMQMKINFLCRDSILAAPIVLDLALLLDLAQRAGECDLQAWLGFYFKSPMAHVGTKPEHDLFRQAAVLKDALRAFMREHEDEARTSGRELYRHRTAV
jgi:myo-inositol-1-phosphate synthase